MSGGTATSPVRLIICVDGTWDTSEGSYDAIKGALSGAADNVKSINDMVKSGAVGDTSGKTYDQRAHYFQGVGTEESARPANVDYPGMHLVVRATSTFQGATGEGYLDILKKAYKVCCSELQQWENDEIFMFGFSRGAFIVRALASFLQYVGVIKPEHMKTDADFDTRFYDLIRKYYELTKKVQLLGLSDRPKYLTSYCQPSPRVRFIGVFDTVKAVFQLPVHNTLKNGVPIIDFEQDAPHLVDHFRHALALNEGRPLFSPTLWKSEVKLAGSSYEEAWFLGFHHDIGGGSERQGLGLWPLQWMLRAAMDKGLVLDTEKERYNVLFSGEGNVFESAHASEMAMKMTDMIHYHTSKVGEMFKLYLNESSWGLLDTPRNYLEYLTKAPYVQHTKARVFLHPSTYLVFDISLSLRIQLYEWRFFRNFIRDRYLVIPENVLPWWENQAVESILKEASSVEHMRLLIYGRPAIGKSSLISRTFGKWVKSDPSSGAAPAVGAVVSEIDKSICSDIGTPISIPENDLVRVHYSDGFGPGGSDSFEVVEQFLTQYRGRTNPEDKLHAIWYCIDCTEDKTNASEKAFFNLDFGEIPVVVVLMKEEELKTKIRKELSGRRAADEKQVEERFNQIIEKKKAELAKLSPRSWVSIGSSVNTIKILLSETSRNLVDTAAQLTQLKAQRVSVKPKVALATAESIRAYAIWKKSKFDGEKIDFLRNAKDEPKLSRLLMRPVLDSFNMRFPGDDALIQSLLSKSWRDLDSYPANLWDKNIPGDLILMCMLDTIIIMARAFNHTQIRQPLGAIAQPLNTIALQLACTWYTLVTLNKQKAMHSRIKSMLSEKDWSPKDISMGSLQMKVIEAVEVGLESAETFLEDIGTGALDGVKKVVGGIGSRIPLFS
ncbi:uncharacterized protein LAJ45_07874 [Morchella importuna]|uniref:uncharacterized protein n=1 Tax=Morchella importuna TaxID=1174673 RepID=UPI001E8E6CC3|nr:uncharacterized protein LAJ45_07874 [Morchella importuna]KAH8148110.1 hypothetical protein LAJ45_07874 [Morchella importuna]